jgi:UPF0716 protein FxsA
MPVLLIFAILLAFPFIELYVLIRLASEYGWWVALYLLATASAGWMLIQEEKLAVFGRLLQIVQTGQHPVVALLSSARTLLAGVLLIFPGVISDIFAILLLLIPMPSNRTPPPPPNRTAANDDIIEGEWTRED